MLQNSRHHLCRIDRMHEWVSLILYSPQCKIIRAGAGVDLIRSALRIIFGGKGDQAIPNLRYIFCSMVSR